MDVALFSAINGAHGPWLDTLMVAASWLGYFPGLWFLSAAAALAWPRLRASAWRACLAVAMAYVMASGIIKPIVARPRPFLSGIVPARTIEYQPPTSYSFPSGHAATAVAGAMAVGRVVPAASWLLWGLAAVIAVSRVYVGVHWPSDILAGAVLGAMCAWLVLAGRHPSVRPWPASARRGTAILRP